MNLHKKNSSHHSQIATICAIFRASTNRLLMLTLCVAVFCVGSAQAQSSGAWSVNVDGNWSSSSNWKNSIVATGTTGVAYFTNAITASRTVNLDASPWTISNLTFTSTGAYGWAITNGTLNLAGTTPGFTVAPNSTATVQSAISGSIAPGSVGLQKSGAGQLILSGSNYFTGTALILGGDLKLGSANALNQTPGSENFVSFQSAVAGSLTLNGNSITVSQIRANSEGTIQNASTTPATLTVGNNLNITSDTWAGNIQDGIGGGALTVVKMGTGMVPMGASTFTGGLYIKAGTVRSANGVGSGTSFSTGTITIGDSTIGQNATLSFSRYAVTYANSIIVASGAGTRTILGVFDNLGASTLSGSIAMNTNLTIQTTNSVTSPTLVLSGALSGTGSLTLNDASTSGGITLSGTNTYTGSTTILAGRVTIGGAGKLGNGDYPSVISNSGTLIYNSTAVQAVGGISGSGSVAINAGTLGCTGTISGPVSVTAVGVLSPSLGTGGSNTLTLTSAAANALTLNSGSRLNFALPNAVTNDQINITGGLTLNGPSYITLSFPGGSAPVGTYTLMTYASTNGTGSLVLDATYPNATLTYDNTKATLTVSGGSTSAGSTLTWKGNVSGNWDTSTANWTNGSAAVAYADGNAVTFDQNASRFSVTGTVSVISPDSVTISNTTAYAIGANIGGTGYLVKNGSGTATLTGTNSYTGFTMIGAGGTLTIGGAGQLGNGNYAGAITHNGTALNFASSAPNTISGGINGVGANSVTFSGTGSQTLSGVNRFGSLTVGNVAGVRAMLTITNGSVANATRSYIGNPANANSNLVVVTGTGSMWNAGGTEINIGYGSKGNVLRVENGGILTNYVSRHGETANSVENGLIITNGGKAFVSSTGGNMGAGAGANGNYVIVAGNGATWSPNTDFHIGNASGVTGNWVKVDQGGIVTNGYFSVGDGGAIGNYMIITNGGKVFSSGTTGLTCDRIGRTGSSYNWVTVGGASGSTNALWNFNSGNLSLGIAISASTGNVLNVICGGDVKGIATLNVGNLTSANNNGVRLNNGGLLEVTTGITLGFATSYGNYVTNSGGVLQFTTATPAIALAGAVNGNAIVMDSGTLSYCNASAVVNVTNNWAVTGTGIGTNTIKWQGANKLRLDNSLATNSLPTVYTFANNLGPTNYVGLELLNGTTAIRGNGITLDGNNGGSLLFSSTAASVINGVALTGSVPVTVSGSCSLTGTVSGAGSLIKLGTGTLTLNSTNTWTGETILSNGTLRISTASGFSANTTVYIYSGATNALAFNGTNTITALYINGKSLPKGVYGADTTGAIGYLTETGYLKTTTGTPRATIIRFY